MIPSCLCGWLRLPPISTAWAAVQKPELRIDNTATSQWAIDD
jgi:hypothetical protein